MKRNVIVVLSGLILSAGSVAAQQAPPAPPTPPAALARPAIAAQSPRTPLAPPTMPAWPALPPPAFELPALPLLPSLPNLPQLSEYALLQLEMADIFYWGDYGWMQDDYPWMKINFAALEESLWELQGQGTGSGTGKGIGKGAGVPGGAPGGVPGGVYAGVPGGMPPGAGAGIPGAGFISNESEDQSQQEREDELYEDGTDYINEAKWEKATEKFKEVVKLKGKKADAALYWQAYAEGKLAHVQNALLLIQTLVNTFPNSKYVKDAKALEFELRNNAGQSVPVSQEDCELKVMALNALMHTDSERAIPMLEKVLRDPQCPGMRDRALFVLAQSSSPKAWEILVQIAKGERNPDLQRKAIQYIGIHGGREKRQVLSEIYASTNELDIKRQIMRAWMVAGEKSPLLTAARGEKLPELRREAVRQLGVMGAGAELTELYKAETDVQVKREILRAYMVAGKKVELLEVARGESNPDLRREAVRQLGVMGARQELMQLYQAESVAEVKAEIIQAMFVGGAADELLQIYRSEKDPALRKRAIRNLGLTGQQRSNAALLEIYANDPEIENKKAVLDALFVQGNAKGLIELARKETNPELKKFAVSKLSVMGSKEATDYLLEILNK